MWVWAALFLLSQVSYCHMWGWSSGWSNEPERKWNGLKVTWGVNPFDSYNSLPRTVEKAKLKGWKAMDTGASCDANYFKGHRYIKYDSDLGQNDIAVMLLFDVNGYIAGMQAGISKDVKQGYPSSLITEPNGPVHNETENEMYTMTAYFVDPAVICGTGRTAQEFANNGTGTGLWIRWGDTNKKIPDQESDLQTSDAKWTKGKCFWTMGMHYWYDIRTDMACDEVPPVFLLYNKKHLNAFGWAFQGRAPGGRYEHPTGRIASFFLPNSVPDCLTAMTDFSTMHIFLTHNARYSSYC